MQPELTEARARWLHAHYLWLERVLPQRQPPAQPRLVFATKEFFPDRYSPDPRSAERVFQRVRELMGLAAWPCRLEPADDVERRIQTDLGRGGVLGDTFTRGPAGTFSAAPGRDVVITYAPAQLKNPVALVATFAHELCHYLLATVAEEPPAGWEALEPLTDLAAVAEGFGVFLCDSAFQFNQWTNHDRQGWSFQNTGYLSEEELAFALAIFCVRRGADETPVARALKPNAREIFLDALDYVADLGREAGAR